MAPAAPIDPATSPKWALRGRVLTMDAQSQVIADGVVWIADAAIAGITRASDAAPEGFDGITPLPTGGTIAPGLIELHNHVAYNALLKRTRADLHKSFSDWLEATAGSRVQ